MPDNDRFRFNLPGKWLRVQRSIGSGDRPERIADLVVKAAAEDLRRLGGLGAMAERIDTVQARSETAGWSEAILEEESVSSRHQMTLLAADQLTKQWALTSPMSALEALAERVISNMTDDRFDRMMPNLVGQGKLTASQLADLRTIVREQPQMAKLRDRLVQRPDAVGLQAPRRSTPSRKLDDLLNTDLGEL